MHSDGCEICTEFHTTPAPDHYRFRGVPADGRVLAETDHFVLVPDYAPLIPGHLLLFTRAHTLSMADCLADDGTHASELLEFLDSYGDECGTLAIIEHGSTVDLERETPCIAHAHLHILPLAAEALVRGFSGDSEDTVTVATWADVSGLSGHEYVLVGDSRSLRLARDWHPPVRQYARFLVGRALGLPDARTYSDTCIFPEVVAATVSEWSKRHVE